MSSNENTTHLAITGLRCAGCVKRVSDALSAVPGVEQAVVNLADRSADVTGTVDPLSLLEAVENTGYQAAIFHDPMEALLQLEATARQEFAEKRRRTVAALTVGFPLMLGMLHMPMIHDEWNAERISWVGIGLLTAAAMLYAGWHFYTGAWKSLKNGAATMDSLIALGTAAAWGYSMLVLMIPSMFPHDARHLYFEAAIMIIGLVNLGSTLESRARGKAQEAIRELVRLQPDTARLVKDNIDSDIDVKAIRPGDLIRLRPGETVPVDGEVVEGHANMEEAMLTGESLPVSKNPGDTVHTGSRCMTGSVIFKATRIGAETALSQIISRVREAQNARPPIANLVDRVAAVFVPAVMMIALVTAITWLVVGAPPRFPHALITTVSVLIIACPCALGLAVPMSIMVGSSLASRHGILIRDGASLQMASKMTTLIFDKTGTLTEGKASVVKLHSVNANSDALLASAATLERGSEHPYAQAILRAAAERQLPMGDCTGFFTANGKGVGGLVEGQSMLLGNQLMMEEQNVSLGETDHLAREWSANGVSPLFVACEGKVIGLIGVADTIKAEARTSITRLKTLGLRIVLLSGDHPRQCAAVARELGIEESYGGMLPEQKLEVIRRYQLQGDIVGMVGDGINDAPALAMANVGFAIGSGTDVAMAASGTTLMNGSLEGIFKAIKISRVTLRNIRQNLFGAFLYNSIAIPVAAGLLYPFTGWLLNPMLAGTAMAASSLTVVLNATRLRSTRLS